VYINVNVAIKQLTIIYYTLNFNFYDCFSIERMNRGWVLYGLGGRGVGGGCVVCFVCFAGGVVLVVRACGFCSPPPPPPGV
jgi:hypothetical protein